ncbi:MAG: hypothetical protein NT023_00235 [Armatimonadetes bacterium]|nr:hypothetical protein [Armatimonadota bacterium]
MSPLKMTHSENDTYMTTKPKEKLNPQQTEAITRLIHLLEDETPLFEGRPSINGARYRTDVLSQTARLRAAHANYGLASLTEMKRVGVGAWIHRKYA